MYNISFLHLQSTLAPVSLPPAEEMMLVNGVCCCCCHSLPVCLPTNTTVAPAVTQEVSLSLSLNATSVQHASAPDIKN